MISDRISDDIRPEMEILNMVIPILMLLCSSVSNWSDTSRIKLHVMERNVTLLMTSNYFRQYIAGYTDANSLRYPIRRRDTKASALELGDNCIQNFHLGRYIIGYMGENLVLRRRASRKT